MHELGIMTGVMDAVQQSAAAAGALKVTRVDLRIGEMTEAIRDALDFAFEALRDLPEYRLCADAELVITMVPPRSKCLECGEEYTHDRLEMLCPMCGSFVTELLEGRELEISSIEVDLPDDEEAAAAEEAVASAEAVAAEEAAAEEAAAPAPAEADATAPALPE